MPGRVRDQLVAPADPDSPGVHEGRKSAHEPAVVQCVTQYRSLLTATLVQHPAWPARRVQWLLDQYGCCYSRSTISRARRRLLEDRSKERSAVQPPLRSKTSSPPDAREGHEPGRRP